MKHLWLILIPTFVVYAGGIFVIICDAVNKVNYRCLKSIFMVCLMAFIAISYTPHYKDISQKQTEKVVAEYVRFQSSSTLPATHKAFFENESGKFSVYVPVYTRDIAKMEIGAVYEIEYFCNSHVIKEYKLLESCK